MGSAVARVVGAQIDRCATMRGVTGTAPYTRGLHEVADGVSAYLQPDGSWGLSNAGLVVDGDASLLVDTLFDLRLTREMLDAMRRATPAAAAIDVVVNTHANGDHCWGNQLVRDAEIVSSSRCAEEMAELPPSILAEVMASPPEGPTGTSSAACSAGSSSVTSRSCSRPRRSTAS